MPLSSFDYFTISMMILVAFVAILGMVSILMPNPLHGKPKSLPKSTLAIKKQVDSWKAKREVEAVRGKLLAFERKPYYKSQNKKNRPR
jgi:hypothetical protein